MIPLTRLLVSLIVVCAFGACSRNTEPAAGDRTAKAPAASGHHVHVAPHGGTLVEVGDHMFNIELVHHAEEGRLSAYILDAHAENFVRLPIPGFEIVALVKGRPESLPMAAVANPVTGETLGDTAEFAGSAEWLKGKVACDGYIPAIEIRGTTFKDVRFVFRSPAPAK